MLCQCPLIERLGVLCDRGWRRASDMRKDSIENERGLVCEVLDVLREITVVDREETDVVVLKGHPIGEMQRPKRIRRFMSLVSHQGPRDQLQGKGLQT